MVELKGSLGGIGLPAIVQLIGELHHSGNLELSRGEAHGVLGFDDGRLVAASLAEERGFKALAACITELGDGTFTFIEGAPVGERTLDLSPSELQRQLSRIVSGEPLGEPIAALSALSDNGADPGVCPLLGFADDRARHYSRSTALHRCYASGVASLVTSQEQRELCLSGRYATCPRYRNTTVSPFTAGMQETSVQAVSPPPQATPALAPPPTSPSPPVPAGVTARLAAAEQLRLANVAAEVEIPAWIGRDRPAKPPAPATTVGVEQDAEAPARRWPRGILLIAGGGVLGLIVVAVALLVAVPAFNSGLAQRQQQAASSAGQAFAPVPTTVRQPTTSAPAVAAARATAPATALPTVTALPRPATPTTNSRASIPSKPAGPRPLIDVRFAAGVPKDWLDNAPYAAWSDGAYRLSAHQAARFVAVGAPVSQPLGDVIVSATLRKTGGPPGGGYGLVIRDTGPPPRDGVNQNLNAYVLETGDLGEFGVWRRDTDHWVDLVPWTTSSAVRTGGSPNELLVRAIGDRLSLTVNGVEVTSLQDAKLAAGGVGIFVGGDYNEVALDRFTIQVPD